MCGGTETLDTHAIGEEEAGSMKSELILVVELFTANSSEVMCNHPPLHPRLKGREEGWAQQPEEGTKRPANGMELPC